MSDLTDAGSEPWRVVQRINTAWRTNQLEALPALFHEQAVIVDAGHRPLAVGRAACVESYRAFVTSATVESYSEESPAVARFGATAVVSYPFQVSYTTGGLRYSEVGSDCLVLTRGAEGWVVVWRQVIWRAA
ncbi:MAG TPA: nuclear transport factor 2 family protein [Gemmatimonadales bacterium]|nr:nuclear transport factor 2 family protein [Gemmatimonadales bacterium]